MSLRPNGSDLAETTMHVGKKHGPQKPTELRRMDLNLHRTEKAETVGKQAVIRFDESSSPIKCL
jgi:hypothetical protein